jgi:hypothetical protein
MRHLRHHDGLQLTNESGLAACVASSPHLSRAEPCLQKNRGGLFWESIMIICLKNEGDGYVREFRVDDAGNPDRVPVETKLTHRVEVDGVEEVETDEPPHPAGSIIRLNNGRFAAAVTAREGLIEIEQHFSNEVSALQAIAAKFGPKKRSSKSAA